MLITIKTMPALRKIPLVYKNRGLVTKTRQPFNVLPTRLITYPTPTPAPAPPSGDPRLAISDSYYTFGNGFVFSYHTIGGPINGDNFAYYLNYSFYVSGVLVGLTPPFPPGLETDPGTVLRYTNTTTYYFTPTKNVTYPLYSVASEPSGQYPNVTGPTKNMVSTINGYSNLVTVVNSNNIRINFTTLPSGANVLPVTGYIININDSSYNNYYSQTVTSSQVINVGSLLSATSYTLTLDFITTFRNADNSFFQTAGAYTESFNTP